MLTQTKNQNTKPLIYSVYHFTLLFWKQPNLTIMFDYEENILEYLHRIKLKTLIRIFYDRCFVFVKRKVKIVLLESKCKMPSKDFKSKTWQTPCGLLRGSSILKLLNRLVKIIKAVISRCIFVLYCFIAVWRVTQALENDLYWLLLLALCPLGLETLHAITKKRTNQLKWSVVELLESKWNHYNLKTN